VHLGQFEAALALWYRGVFLVVVSHLSTYVTMGATLPPAVAAGHRAGAMRCRWGTKEDPHTFDLVTFSSYEVEDLGSYMGEERKRVGEPS
jgi:hypothetical protein